MAGRTKNSKYYALKGVVNVRREEADPLQAFFYALFDPGNLHRFSLRLMSSPSMNIKRPWDEYGIMLEEAEEDRENAETIGYYAMFEYVNGFKKAMYWSKKKMEAHALRYSKGYAAKKGYTFWEKDFDGMAYKTMLRQLISKWGIMSVDLQTAYEKDTAVIKESGDAEFVGDAPDEATSQTETPEPTKVDAPQPETAQQPSQETPPASEPAQQGFDFFAGT